MSTNDVTGDRITSKIGANNNYRDRYDRVFTKKLKYKLRYSDGSIVNATFSSHKEADWYFHNEGDHLVEVIRVDSFT